MSHLTETAAKLRHPALRENYYCLIGNEMLGAQSGKTVPTFNPATGEKLADVPAFDAGDVDRAVQSAQKAFQEWKRIPAPERGGYCRRLAERLRARKDVYAALDALDGGNPVSKMRVDVEMAAAQLDYFGGLGTEIKGETIPAVAGTLNFTIRQPYGVVGRINPWNHPILFAAARIAAPLVAGNTVVLKNSISAPLSCLELGYDIRDIFPPGVVNVICGSGREAGAALVRHPGVRRLALTGSTEVGQDLMRVAADEMKAISLELGGKNPMIIFPDVDMEAAVTSAFNGMNYTWCQGQSCGSTSRLFLHRDIHDEFVGRLAEKMKKVRIGLPIEEETEMGCLVSEEQFKTVMSYIEIGKKEGARLVTGGGKPSKPELQRGTFVEPTLFDQVDYRMRLAQEEIFGPVESVISWSKEDEVIEMANSSMYGLTASIWTRDISTALRMASEVESGYIWINDSSKHYLGVPFGGYKQSGLGRDEGLSELLSHTQVKSVNVNLA